MDLNGHSTFFPAICMWFKLRKILVYWFFVNTLDAVADLEGGMALPVIFKVQEKYTLFQ